MSFSKYISSISALNVNKSISFFFRFNILILLGPDTSDIGVSSVIVPPYILSDNIIVYVCYI